MELKAGHWKCKGCNIDYILNRFNDDFYYLYCIQTKNNYRLEVTGDTEIKNFLSNHYFVCDMEYVYEKYYAMR